MRVPVLAVTTGHPKRRVRARERDGIHEWWRERSIKVFSPLFPQAKSKWIRVSKRMNVRLQRIIILWKVTLHRKCSTLGRPWEVRTMNVKVDFTICISLDCVIDVAAARTHRVFSMYANLHNTSTMFYFPTLANNSVYSVSGESRGHKGTIIAFRELAALTYGQSIYVWRCQLWCMKACSK